MVSGTDTHIPRNALDRFNYAFWTATANAISSFCFYRYWSGGMGETPYLYVETAIMLFKFGLELFYDKFTFDLLGHHTLMVGALIMTSDAWLSNPYLEYRWVLCRTFAIHVPLLFHNAEIALSSAPLKPSPQLVSLAAGWCRFMYLTSWPVAVAFRFCALNIAAWAGMATQFQPLGVVGLLGAIAVASMDYFWTPFYRYRQWWASKTIIPPARGAA
jgi:hypothetical protein